MFVCMYMPLCYDEFKESLKLKPEGLLREKLIELNKLPFFMRSGYSLVFYCVSCISYYSSQLANRIE